MQGQNLLQGKKGLIFGALNDQSLAWQVALACRAQGASLSLSNAPIAQRLGAVSELARLCEAPFISADVSKIEDIEALADQVGPVDFILHAIGMSSNVRKKRPYDDLNYDFYKQTLEVSAISLHKILQTFDKKDLLKSNGSVVSLSYIAAQRTFPDYSDMAEAKAVLESITRSYGYRLGKRKQVRVNTISQSPTKTSAGTGISGFDAFYSYADRMSPLGNASATDCANYCVFLFSDLSRSITMQNLMCDGGFSSVGISQEVMELIAKNQ